MNATLPQIHMEAHRGPCMEGIGLIWAPLHFHVNLEERSWLFHDGDRESICQFVAAPQSPRRGPGKAPYHSGRGSFVLEEDCREEVRDDFHNLLLMKYIMHDPAIH